MCRHFLFYLFTFVLFTQLVSLIDRYILLYLLRNLLIVENVLVTHQYYSMSILKKLFEFAHLEVFFKFSYLYLCIFYILFFSYFVGINWMNLSIISYIWVKSISIGIFTKPYLYHLLSNLTKSMNKWVHILHSILCSL